jgi:hypothetical protein
MTEPYQRETELDRSSRIDLDIPQPPMVPETEAERAARQPLFNKGRMIFWAMITLVAWLSITKVLPIAFESAKSAIKESLAEASKPGVNPEIRTIILPNGKKITITKNGHGVTISETSPGEAAAPAPATVTLPPKPAAPPEPATPATPPAPAKK